MRVLSLQFRVEGLALVKLLLTCTAHEHNPALHRVATTMRTSVYSFQRMVITQSCDGGIRDRKEKELCFLNLSVPTHYSRWSKSPANAVPF